MKTLLFGMLITSSTANLFAQGTVKCGNVGAGTGVTNILTGQPVSGTTFKAALYYAPDGVSDEAAFIPLYPPSISFLSSGQFAAGTRTTPATTPPGGIAMFQFRAWEVAFGTSYEQAFANQNTMGGRFALTGKSDVVRVKTGDPGNNIPPGTLVASPAPGLGGVRGFYVTTNSHGPVIIVRQPKNVNIAAGDPALFSVTAEGRPPLHYQWRFRGTNVADATNAAYFLLGVQPVAAGPYDVVVGNDFGSVTSQVAILTLPNASLSVNINGNGTVTRVPNQTILPLNATVTLTAAPDLGYVFLNWTGDASGNANPLTLTLDTSKTVTANFVSTALQLAIQGMGSVTKTPDQPFYQLGEQVTLTAVPERYHAFTQWSDGVTDNPRVITIGSNNSYTAILPPTQPLERLTFGGISRLAPVGMPAIFVNGRFIAEGAVTNRGFATVTILTTFTNGVVLYTLDGGPPALIGAIYTGPFYVGHSVTLRVLAYNIGFTESIEADPVEVVVVPALQVFTPGGGTVTVTPPDGPYFSNSMATVSATPAPGWKFLQWLGDATGTNPTVHLQMTRDKCAQAIFGTTLNLVETEGGALVADPVAEYFAYGAHVRLIAVARSGYYFVLWGGAAAGTNNTVNFVVTNATPAVSALFALLGLEKNALTILPLGNGRVTTTPRANRYDNGATVTLNAIPDPGEIFLGWNGDAGGTTSPLQVTLEQTRWISASFTRRPRLSVSSCPGPLNHEVFPLRLTGELGRYSLESSSDLANWMPLATLTNLFGTVQFNDTLTTNSPNRFYRVSNVP